MKPDGLVRDVKKKVKMLSKYFPTFFRSKYKWDFSTRNIFVITKHKIYDMKLSYIFLPNNKIRVIAPEVTFHIYSKYYNKNKENNKVITITLPKKNYVLSEFVKDLERIISRYENGK